MLRPAPARPSRHRPTPWSVLPAVLLLIGCASDDAGSGGSAPDRAALATANDPSAPPPLDPELQALADEVEQQYVIGPAAARTMGYRVDWQYPALGNQIKIVEVTGDAVLVLDDRNFLTRLSRDDGARIWRRPMLNPVEEVFGVTYVPELERIYVTTGPDLLVIDGESGSRLGKQRLDQFANTAPIRLGDFLLYGSRGGQVVWHSFRLDAIWRAYQVAQYMGVSPVYSEGYVVAVGAEGRVMSLHAETASQVWSYQALDWITAAPAVGNGAVYLASRDQHLRAFDLAQRRSPLWQYLTQSSLLDAPVLLGDAVYQRVPGHGLHRFEALPNDRPGGVLTWSVPDADGTVITSLGDRLIAWNPRAKQLELVSARFGALMEVVPVPQVDRILATDLERGALYATAADGRISRLVPRNAAP